jgi:hypothetical protein
MRWYSLISGKPIIVKEFIFTWDLEDWLCEHLLVVDVTNRFLFNALNRRLFCAKPNLAVLLIVCDAGYRLDSIKDAASFALLYVSKKDFSVFSACPNCRSVVHIG